MEGDIISFRKSFKPFVLRRLGNIIKSMKLFPTRNDTSRITMT